MLTLGEPICQGSMTLEDVSLGAKACAIRDLAIRLMSSYETRPNVGATSEAPTSTSRIENLRQACLATGHDVREAPAGEGEDIYTIFLLYIALLLSLDFHLVIIQFAIAIKHCRAPRDMIIANESGRQIMICLLGKGSAFEQLLHYLVNWITVSGSAVCTQPLDAKEI